MIGGLQKVTLLDFPGKVACTVFLTGCNLRCPYCHNPELVLPRNNGKTVSENALFEFLFSRKGKLDGVCITGGEPTLYPSLPDLIRRIRKMGYLLSWTVTEPFLKCLNIFCAKSCLIMWQWISKMLPHGMQKPAVQM